MVSRNRRRREAVMISRNRADNLLAGWTTEVGPTGRMYMRGPNGELTRHETGMRIADAAGRPAGCRGCSRLFVCAGTASCPFEPGSSKKYPLPRRREAIEHTRRKRANTTR